MLGLVQVYIDCTLDLFFVCATSFDHNYMHSKGQRSQRANPKTREKHQQHQLQWRMTSKSLRTSQFLRSPWEGSLHQRTLQHLAPRNPKAHSHLTQAQRKHLSRQNLTMPNLSQAQPQAGPAYAFHEESPQMAKG